LATKAEFERVLDRLEWSWDHLQRFKLRLLEAGVRYHWMRTEKIDTATGGYVDFVVDKACPIPEDAPFILGDCIHNLRASLDALVYFLCPKPDATFPICRTKGKWTRSKSKIRPLPKEAQKIVFALQPFRAAPGADAEASPLWILDRLWKDGLHGAPHLVAAVTGPVSVRSEPPGWLHVVQVLGGPVEVGSVVQRVWLIPGTEPRMEVTFGFDVAFDAMGPARGQSAYHCLAELHEHVAEVVELFRPFFA
jgi:hypothetical protein